MGKLLILAEKPSVAREIANAIGGIKKTVDWLEGDEAVVTSGIGHLVELYVPEAASSGKDMATLPVIPSQFSLKPIETTKKQFNLISKLMKRADVDSIVNACDAGREGELIFRLIYELAGCQKPIRRMWLQSMTAESIRKAYKNMRPGSEYNALSDAARSRSEADWLVGINGSRGITRLKERQTQNYEAMSVGRVQTPTLAILVNREKEIKEFKPKDYWEVHGVFSVKAGHYVGRWVHPKKISNEEVDDADAGFKIWDRSIAEQVLLKCSGVNPSTVSDESKTTKSLPPKLFDLTTLQREANKRFKFSAKKTLDIAQALYETHKATTYPRTDSNALPEDYLTTASETVGNLNESPYDSYAHSILENGWIKKEKRVFDDSKISDHFAIIPTGNKPNNLNADEAKIYDMVVRRFLAVFFPPAEYSLTKRTTVIAGETFLSSGRVLLKSGWLEVYGQQNPEKDNDQPSLCPLEEGEPVKTDNIQIKPFQTKPPSHFTEAGLLYAMEVAGKMVNDEELKDAMKDKGLGTPATRASIIEGLLKAKDSKGNPKTAYVTREGKEQYLIPTGKGIELITFLNGNGIEFLASPSMTGEWEHKLKQIEGGELQRKTFMEEIAAVTTLMIDVMRQRAGELPVPDMKVIKGSCPVCGSHIISKPKKYACEAGCGFTLWREIAGHDLTEREAEQLLSEGHIASIDNFVSKKKTRFTAGLRLNSEHKAEFVFPDSGTKEDSPIFAAAPCPKCGSDLAKKSGKFSQIFCNNCEFLLWTTIAGKSLNDDEAGELIKHGELHELNGFISNKTNKRFSAGLRMSSDKTKVSFVFNKVQ